MLDRWAALTLMLAVASGGLPRCRRHDARGRTDGCRTEGLDPLRRCSVCPACRFGAGGGDVCSHCDQNEYPCVMQAGPGGCMLRESCRSFVDVSTTAGEEHVVQGGLLCRSTTQWLSRSPINARGGDA
jgi:hypothetical protein